MSQYKNPSSSVAMQITMNNIHIILRQLSAVPITKYTDKLIRLYLSYYLIFKK